MSLENIFPILNQMEAEGIIGRYAIGGAVRAIFSEAATYFSICDDESERTSPMLSKP